MANNVKIIKSVQFTAIRNYLESLGGDVVLGEVMVKEQTIPYTADMAIELIDHEIELLTKKNTPGKLTKVQEENIKLTEAVYEGMELGKPYTVTEIIKSVPVVAGMNISKVRPLLTPLMEAEKVKREEVKGKAIFTKIA
jgi:hypothetical protein